MNLNRFVVLFFLIWFCYIFFILDRGLCTVDFSKKIEEYFIKLDKALLKNNLIKAREYCSKILILDSNNSVAKEKMLTINENIEGQQQIHGVNKKKYQKVKKVYWVKALKYFNKGDFVFAKDEFKKILEIDPTDVKALKYLEFINKKIDKVNSLQTYDIFKQGLNEFNEGNYEKALSYFSTAYLVDSSIENIQYYIDECKYKINEVNSALLYRASSSRIKTISNKKIKEEMEEFYNKGLEQLADEDYKTALETFNKLKVMANINKVYVYDKQIDNYIRLCKEEISKQLYEEGEMLEMEEQLQKSYAKYELASKYNPLNKKAKSKLERLKTVFSQKF